MIFETKIFIKWFFLLTKIMLWKFFWNHQKNHAIENHVMEIHVRRGLAVAPNTICYHAEIFRQKSGKILNKCYSTLKN